jgi:hypothetical protein
MEAEGIEPSGTGSQTKPRAPAPTPPSNAQPGHPGLNQDDPARARHRRPIPCVNRGSAPDLRVYGAIQGLGRRYWFSRQRRTGDSTDCGLNLWLFGTHMSDDQYSPEEAKARFEATLRGALKTPPIWRQPKQKAEEAPAPASSATAKTGRRVSGNQASSTRR